MTTTIIIFAYKRPKYLRKMLGSLIDNFPIDIDIYGIVDYSVMQEKITCILKAAGIKNIIKRKYKFGLRKNIISGISSTVRYYDSVIVLEDDIIIPKGFINSMIGALNEPHKGFASVSGNSKKKKSLIPSSWGWATWAETWKKFEKECTLNHISEKELNKFGKIKAGFKKEYLKELKNPTTWDIEWTYFHFKHNLFCKHIPYKVKHIGKSGDHYKWYSVFGVRQYLRMIKNYLNEKNLGYN